MKKAPRNEGGTYEFPHGVPRPEQQRHEEITLTPEEIAASDRALDRLYRQGVIGQHGTPPSDLCPVCGHREIYPSLICECCQYGHRQRYGCGGDGR